MSQCPNCRETDTTYYEYYRACSECGYGSYCKLCDEKAQNCNCENPNIDRK